MAINFSNSRTPILLSIIVFFLLIWISSLLPSNAKSKIQGASYARSAQSGNLLPADVKDIASYDISYSPYKSGAIHSFSAKPDFSDIKIEYVPGFKGNKERIEKWQKIVSHLKSKYKLSEKRNQKVYFFEDGSVRAVDIFSDLIPSGVHKDKLKGHDLVESFIEKEKEIFSFIPSVITFERKMPESRHERMRNSVNSLFSIINGVDCNCAHISFSIHEGIIFRLSARLSSKGRDFIELKNKLKEPSLSDSELKKRLYFQMPYSTWLMRMDSYGSGPTLERRYVDDKLPYTIQEIYFAGYIIYVDYTNGRIVRKFRPGISY